MAKILAISFFNIKMESMVEQFGKRGISYPKQKLIYEVVKTLTEHEFSRITDEIIGNMKFAPTVDDVRDKARRYMSSVLSEVSTPCSLCHGHGCITVRKKTGEIGEYSYACTCENGVKYSAFPKWQNSLRTEYTMQLTPIVLVNKFYGFTEEERVCRIKTNKLIL